MKKDWLLQRAPRITTIFLVTVLLLACAGSYPVLAQEPAVEDATENPVVPDLIGRIVMDPNRNFDSVRGPDDCRSESVYQSAKAALGSYAVNPEANSAALKEYVMSGGAECNCASAIVGQYFNNLLDDIGSDLSSVPCL